jgi:putative phage-type endonuclease
MRVLDLEQHTVGWHRWRAGGIGASDAPALMGVHVSGITADQLLAEKLGRERREVTFPMKRGLREESPARLLCEERLGWCMRPACVQHDEIAWLRASLDGLDWLDQALVEIKCPNVVDHEVALAGVVPHHYVPQVQHQLLVSGCALAYYASYSKAVRFGGPDAPSLALVEVEPDAEYLARLLEAEEAFWERLSAARRGRVA